MTYMSRFSRALSTEEIDRLGERSALRNAEDGITGALVTLGSVFFQIFEGDDDPVDHLYARVLRDDRHTDIICLRTEAEITDRLFPDWSMNVFDLDQVAGEVLEPLKLLLSRMSESQHIIERYTQPAVSRIMTQGLDPLDVPLHKVDRVVLFTDMVAFSAISDRLPIENVSDLVSTYLEACSVSIARHGGEVTKFLGDGVMAYFASSAADEALQSCVDTQVELERIRQKAPPRSALRLIFSGFGLALGPVLEGSIGSSVKMDYTIIGEPVNTAARLEALTRTLDKPVLMTASVCHAAQASWDLAYEGEFGIGRDDPIGVHSLATPTGGRAATVSPTGGGMRAAVEQQLDAVTTPPEGNRSTERVDEE